MLARDLFELRTTLEQRGIIFAYSGYVTEPVLSGVGEALKRKLEIDDADTKTLRSVFAVFVEQMQNIIRYSAEKTIGPRQGEIRSCSRRSATASSPSARRAASTSFIRVTSWSGRMSSGCARKLTKIRDMNKEELRALHKEQLRSEPEEGSKGAGLGFMEIARRASRPIEFDFIDVDTKHAFFSLKATV